MISAVATNKNGESPGIDNILAEFIKEGTIDVMHKLCNLIWRTGNGNSNELSHS